MKNNVSLKEKMNMEELNNQFRSFMSKQRSKKFDRCLWPTMDCRKKAIRAHSIQNKGVLKYLSSKNGHVVMLEGKINFVTGPTMDFQEVGRNRATTFTGLCSHHDNQLFAPIDAQKLNIHDPEHLFLLAYRSTFRGYHAKLKKAFDIQSVYMKGIAIGKFAPETQDVPFWLATTALTEAHAFFCYKSQFDICYFEKNYGRIEHEIIVIPDLRPSIAVSSVFSIGELPGAEETIFDPSLIVLNIFPCEGKIFIIFSYPKVHEQFVKDFILFYKKLDKRSQLYQISKLILRHCENFAMKPSYFMTLSSETIEAMKKYFIENLFTKRDYEDEKLYLF